MKLDLGCGCNVRGGFLGVDKSAHDLNIFPYPWDKETVDEVWMSHILEHLENPVETMREVSRILIPGGKVTVKVPHASGRCAWGHAEHKRAFNLGWMNTLLDGEGGDFKPVNLNLTGRRLRWSASNYRNGKSARWFERGLDWLINIKPCLFERLFIYWVGGCEEVEWTLTKGAY